MAYIEPCVKFKNYGKEKNQENKEILEKYLRIGPNKEMRERRQIQWMRRKEMRKRKKIKKREKERELRRNKGNKVKWNNKEK